MNAVQFYEGLFASAGFAYNHDQDALFSIDNGNVFVTINKKCLVLPTDNILSSFNKRKEDIIVYHPVHENMSNRDSDTLRYTLSLFRMVAGEHLMLLMREIAALNADPTRHNDLTKKQMDILKKIPDIDEKFSKTLEKIHNVTDAKKKERILNFVLERGTAKTGASRLCHIDISLLENMAENNNESIYGVKLRKVDRQSMLDLFQLFTSRLKSKDLSQDNPFRFTAVTNETTAPSFRVLCEAYGDVMKVINDLYTIFKSKFTPMYPINLDWLAGLDNLKTYRQLIPSFPGNTGEEVLKPKVPTPMNPIAESAANFNTKPVVNATPTPPPAPRTPVMTQPAPTVDVSAASRPLTKDDFKSLAEYLNYINTPKQMPVGQPMVPYQNPMNGYNYQQPNYQMGYQQQQPMYNQYGMVVQQQQQYYVQPNKNGGYLV